MVMEFMEHDIMNLMENMKRPFRQAEVKCLLKQLLEAMAFLHDNWIIHRYVCMCVCVCFEIRSNDIVYAATWKATSGCDR